MKLDIFILFINKQLNRIILYKTSNINLIYFKKYLNFRKSKYN